MSKHQQQVIKEPKCWVDITASIATIIGAFFGVLVYFYGSVIVTDIQGASSCDGFLTNDPSAYVQMNAVSSKKEKEYLENKISCYRDRIQKNPNNAVAYTNMGEAERRLGNLDGARKAHQKALKLKPELPEAKIGLALVEQDMGNKAAANQAIQGVLALNPTKALAHFYQGAILYAQDELKDAEGAWQKAKELDPGLPRLIPTWRALSVKKDS